MVPTYLQPGQDEKDGIKKEGSCLAKVYIHILEIGLGPAPDDTQDID